MLATVSVKPPEGIPLVYHGYIVYSIQYFIQRTVYTSAIVAHIYMAQPWAPPPPPPGDGHGSLPRPLWEWVGWLWMGGNAG